MSHLTEQWFHLMLIQPAVCKRGSGTPWPGVERVGQSVNLLLGCIKSTSTLLFELSILQKPCESSAAGCHSFFLAELSLFFVILLITSNYNKRHLN